MNKRVCTSRVLLAVSIVVAHLALCGVSYAGDYGGKDFSLRFPAALARFATYADVAGGGGASAASKWSTSVNPAATDWLKLEGEIGVSACPQWAHLSFDTGTDINVFMESVTVDGRDAGTFIVGAAQISSNERTDATGVDFYFVGDMYLAQWGKKFNDDSAVGFAFTYTKSLIRNGLMGMIPLAKAEADSYAVRAGGLHQLTEQWRVGAVVDYGWSSDRTAMYAVPALGLPAGTIKDQTHQILLRPGVAYEYMKDGAVYVDYQLGFFWNDTGTLNVHRLYAGVDHGFTEWLFGRVGTTVDVEGGAAVTAGIGFYPAAWLSVDAAYQMDMFPEIDNEFGGAHTVQVSVALTI